MMAIEAIKGVTGYGQSLFSKMLLYNLAYMDFSTIVIHRGPDCPVCGALQVTEGVKE
jgi:adenylyltransferase/sulfurtransferase